MFTDRIGHFLVVFPWLGASGHVPTLSVWYFTVILRYLFFLIRSTLRMLEKLLSSSLLKRLWLARSEKYQRDE